MTDFEVSFSDIQLDTSEVYRTMGSERYTPDSAMRTQVKRVLSVCTTLCRPCFGYEILPAGTGTEHTIDVAGTSFATGPVITPCFAGAEYFAIFVATAGADFDAWLRGQKLSGDIIGEFVGDAIGSEIAEAAARLAARNLEKEAAASAMKISNSYSPGYCGWTVRQQELLFSLLPSTPCGITLNDSCLMHPIKSVSGIIALGEKVEKKPYGCAICRKEDCYKKRSSGI